MKRYVYGRHVIFALVATLAALVPAVSAGALSSDCEFVDAVDGSYGSFDGSLELDAGEVITVTASAPFTGDEPPTHVTLSVDGVPVSSAAFPGTVTYTVPSSDSYAVTWETVPAANVLWAAACDASAGPQDSDGDGVVDEEDLCADTSLPDRPEHLKKNRFATTAGGQFVDANHTASGVDIAATGGCSGSQIAEAMGLGGGHLRFGITRGALMEWVGSI